MHLHYIWAAVITCSARQSNTTWHIVIGLHWPWHWSLVTLILGVLHSTNSKSHKLSLTQVLFGSLGATTSGWIWKKFIWCFLPKKIGHTDAQLRAMTLKANDSLLLLLLLLLLHDTICVIWQLTTDALSVKNTKRHWPRFFAFWLEINTLNWFKIRPKLRPR